ncbi:hypothetical protein JET14_12160 [Martelella lutilitoris]|uniref:Tetratricopeptide repeat protein n=1 Tax=Martelella lutilitoris TaxID=2583532 RepID=A0A7T7KJZ4_9HYPH|nr:hypothetical protein [Martelella lutilitoris]QQM29091.1 hypothetical protein JET14_12160 [Martelella lutilitoris]
MEEAIAVYGRNPGNPIERASLAYYLALAHVNAGNASAALNTTQAAFAYRPELVSRYPEFYWIEGWAKARLGLIAQAVASYSAGIGLAEAYNEAEPGRFAPETLAALRVQEAYLSARSSTVPSAALTTGVFDALADMPDNDSGAKALRRSILAMIDDPEHSSWSQPGVWAPFVTVGW